jgi:hypothetical protein
MSLENQTPKPQEIDLNQIRDEVLARKQASTEEPQSDSTPDISTTVPEEQPQISVGTSKYPDLTRLREAAGRRSAKLESKNNEK